MKIAVLTLGCKVNQAESSDWQSSLKSLGHSIVDLNESPDACIINTCTVTAKSDYQSRQLIRRAERAGAKVYVTGCYAELNKSSVGAMKRVEAVIANNDKESIIRHFDKCDVLDNEAVGSSPRTRKFIKIQDGCDQQCSYCLIWKARGNPKSALPEDVIGMVVKAVDDGFKEIVLTGVHLGLYGHDLTGIDLAGIVKRILDETSIKRIRLSSLEISEIDDRLMDLFADPRICRHLHIPLQSGDDGVLGLMNRRYDTKAFADKISLIAKRHPGISIGTDVIAGFPQEWAAAFDNTVKLIESLPLSYLHVFPYSNRPGTGAADMKDIVGDRERKRRASVLRAIGELKKDIYIRSNLGCELEVLVEESDESGASVIGTTGNFLRVTCNANEGFGKGDLVKVKATGVEGGMLRGEPIHSYT